MKMVRADVHLILLKATPLLWLVSSDFNASLLRIKVFDISTVILQAVNIEMIDCVHVFTSLLCIQVDTKRLK